MKKFLRKLAIKYHNYRYWNEKSVMKLRIYQLEWHIEGFEYQIKVLEARLKNLQD